MLLSEQPRKVPLAFAENGEKTTIPEETSPFAGKASLNDGFPPLTRTALDDGGIPPDGLDMNGILYLVSLLNRWQSAGGAFVYDSVFANDTNVVGYPKGAVLLRADGTGFWVNKTDSNTTNPDTGGANWQPINNIGITTKTMTNADVTLTALESARDVIVISGTLSANVNLIFPTTIKQWLVVNNTSGAFTLTAKTASGTGGLITQSTSRAFYADGTNLYGVNALAATQTQVNTGTDKLTFVTPETFHSGVDYIFNNITSDIKTAILKIIYPVGTPYFNKVDNSNPNTIFGVTVGTWAQETGKVLVGQDTGQLDFDVLGETGGNKTVPLTMSLETRTSGTGGQAPPYSTTVTTNDTFSDWIILGDAVASPDVQGRMKFNEASNLQPYVVYSWWVRTS